MAKLATYTYGSNTWSPGDANLAVTFLNSLNCLLINVELLSEYNFQITFENGVILKAYGYGNPGSKLTVIDDSHEVTINQESCRNWGSKTITVVYSDKIFYFRIKNSAYNSSAQFLYEHIGDNRKLYSFVSGETGLTDQANICFYDYVTKCGYQRNVKTLTHSVPSGTVDFTKYSGVFSMNYFSNTGQEASMMFKVFDDPLLYACTTITKFQTITIDDKNYYTLSPNLLVELDSE